MLGMMVATGGSVKIHSGTEELMRICVQCKARVEDADVHTKPEMSDENYALLVDVANQLGRTPEPKSQALVTYHIRDVMHGMRRPGVCGGWWMNQEDCGPLREPTPAEVSEHEALEAVERLAAMGGQRPV